PHPSGAGGQARGQAGAGGLPPERGAPAPHGAGRGALARVTLLSQERDPRRPCTGAGAPSPLRFGAAGHGPGATDPCGASWALRRRPRSRAAPCRTAGSPRGRPAGELSRRDAQHPQTAQVQGGAGDVPFVAHFVTRRNMKRRKPIACLLSACRRKTCGTRARPNSAAGRRGRRRSAYEAPPPPRRILVFTLQSPRPSSRSPTTSTFSLL